VKDETLCWSCKNSLCGCSWSKHFVPVKNWVATPTIIFWNVDGNIYQIESFKVEKCPLYKHDGITKLKTKTNSQIAKELGISVRTLYRRMKKQKARGL
jgi:hypothetical protein